MRTLVMYPRVLVHPFYSPSHFFFVLSCSPIESTIFSLIHPSNCVFGALPRCSTYLYVSPYILFTRDISKWRASRLPNTSLFDFSEVHSCSSLHFDHTRLADANLARALCTHYTLHTTCLTENSLFFYYFLLNKCSSHAQTLRIQLLFIVGLTMYIDSQQLQDKFPFISRWL